MQSGFNVNDSNELTVSTHTDNSVTFTQGDTRVTVHQPEANYKQIAKDLLFFGSGILLTGILGGVFAANCTGTSEPPNLDIKP